MIVKCTNCGSNYFIEIYQFTKVVDECYDTEIHFRCAICGKDLEQTRKSNVTIGNIKLGQDCLEECK